MLIITTAYYFYLSKVVNNAKTKTIKRFMSMKKTLIVTEKTLLIVKTEFFLIIIAWYTQNREGNKHNILPFFINSIMLKPLLNNKKILRNIRSITLKN